LFEAIETTWQTLARNLIELLDAYGLRNKIIIMWRMKVLI
jgi:methanogenic corrinoid protein MtbC1